MSHFSFWSQQRRKNIHSALDKQLVGTISGFRLPRLKQLKYLRRIISSREYRIIQILSCALIVNLVFLGWKLYEAQTKVLPKDGGKYTEALIGTPQTINPLFLQNNDVDRDIVSLVYSGLSRYDDQRHVVGDLAEKFEIGKDEKTYTFFLRRDAKWHDGKPLTTDDILFTFSRIQDPAAKSSLYYSFRDVRIEKIDDATIRFILPKPFAPFLDLTTVQILPEHLWNEIAPENLERAALNLKPVGSGQWKFKSFQKDRDGTIRSYTLVRNDEYFGLKPHLNKLVFKFYPDGDSAIQALKNRNVEGVSFLPRELRDRLKQDRDLRYYIFNLPQYTAIFFNQLNNPELSSKAVRQALAYAINKDRIVKEVLSGEGVSIHAPIIKGFLGYNEHVKQYPYDLQKSSNLLQVAGWKKNTEGFWVKSLKKTSQKKDNAKEGDVAQEKILEINLITINDREHRGAAEIIKEGWGELGISVDIQFVDPSRIKEDIIDSREYQALLYGEMIGSDPDLYPFWHSSQARAPGLNLAIFSSKEADTFLEEGRQITDEKKRAEHYKRFQDILAEEVPAIFLYDPSYNYVVHKKVKGIQDGKEIVHPSDRFIDIAAWHVKTKRILKK